ncbi:LytR/AlgR family response regulator transcription factor [Flavobacterium silvaticum]|uniref:DNA-binding response regulator n=1 Tax=Flavobacterium silvaticum TaxID=1852020 RepID=A0A972FQT0_9FLAO|nr:LytTR family DNA-binding domain-containing protein [Flavobacterium silvaticum]NMH27664.1 DNA-binding response regulator [Flavobacterium silvaticum]
MKHQYVIITDNHHELAETKAALSLFPKYECCGTAADFDSGLELVLEKLPDLIFLEIDPDNPESGLNLSFISELYRFLNKPPQIIVTAKSQEKAFQVLKYGVLDMLVAPFRSFELRKTLLRFEKDFGTVPIMEVVRETPEPTPIIATIEAAPIEKPLILCVKSYGDYRFIEAADILYMQADNNSTDIYLRNGEMVTAFKTLKQFETSLKLPFVRIHNSYIVNSDFVTRIHLGNSVCYLKDSLKIPFSKSYKDNVDGILNQITGGNYLEF